MFVFRKIWRALFSSNNRFEIPPFALLPTKLCKTFQITFYLPSIYLSKQKITPTDLIAFEI